MSSVQLLSCIQLFATPWTAAHQPSLSITNSQSLLKLMSMGSVMPSNHLIFCRSLLQWTTFCQLEVMCNISRSTHEFSSVAQLYPTLCDPMDCSTPRPPCPSLTPGVYSNLCPLSRWYHPTILSSAISFSSCLQSFPASGSFSMSQFFTWRGQSIGVTASASVLPVNIQDWFPLGWTGWISLQSKGLSRVFSNTTVQKHQFFGAQLSLYSNSHIHTWLLEKL